MEGLKPCPFCGRVDTLSLETARSCEECKNYEDYEKCPNYEPFDNETDKCPYKTIVCCCNKGGCGSSGGWAFTKEKAIEVWNRRVSAIWK